MGRPASITAETISNVEKLINLGVNTRLACREEGISPQGYAKAKERLSSKTPAKSTIAERQEGSVAIVFCKRGDVKSVLAELYS